MKIAIDGQCLSQPQPHKAVDYTITLAKHLVDRGMAVSLLHRKGDLPMARLLSGIVLELLPVGSPGKALLRKDLSIARALSEGGFDILHIPTEDGQAPISAPCPVVMTFHRATCPESAHKPAAGNGTLAILRQKLRGSRVDRVIATAEACGQQIISALAFPPDRVTEIPYITTVPASIPGDAGKSFPETLRDLGVRAPYLINAGGYQAESDVKALLNAFARIRQNHPELLLVLVGERMAHVRLLEHACKCGLRVDEDVLFLFGLGSQIRFLYENAALAFSLAFEHPCQRWLVQALSCGVQAVCADSPCARQLVGGAGAVVNCAEPEAAASAVSRLLRSGNAAQRAAIARHQAARFNPEAAIDATLVVYAAARGSGNSRRLAAGSSQAWWDLGRP